MTQNSVLNRAKVAAFLTKLWSPRILVESDER